MVDLTRRSFLGGLLAVTAVAIVKPPKFNNYPVLYMDGERDDAPALQAMLDCEPYIVEGELITGQTKAHISGGEYRIGSTLNINRDSTIIEGATFIGNFDGYMMQSYNVNNIYIANCLFDCTGGRGTSAIELGKELKPP